MGYLAVWKVLEEMISDLRKRGKTIPSGVMNNLKSANTLIKILRADPSCRETCQKIEEYLGSVESYLVSEGQMFGTEYVNQWLKRLEDANRKIPEEEETRFVSGLPRQQKWIRVKPSTDLPLEKLRLVAEKLELSCEAKNDGYLLVCGEDERIKEFVKKMARKYRLKVEK